MRRSWLSAMALAVIMLSASASQQDDDRLSAEMSRLGRAKRQAQKAGICNIHHVRMQRKLVPIDAWCASADSFSTPWYYASMRSFPHAAEYVWMPGYDIERAQHERRWKYICPECKRAELRWAMQHPKDEDAKLILKDRKT
jgi:hypothetical protein